jgi:bifunctional non-homologous end joining protein LigD
MPREVPYEVVHETKTRTEIEVDGRTLRLSNREKLLYPDAAFTKGEVIDYYARVAPALLPHLRGHPVTLKRYPNGVDESFFYQKRCPSPRPAWLATAEIAAAGGADTIAYCLANDLPSLLWMANLASLELHTSLSLSEEPGRPTAIVFDLDPGAGAGVRECCHVALRIRAVCEALGLLTFVKTSGAKGIQVYLPLNSATSYAHTKPFARAVAGVLERQEPGRIISRMSKSLRRGRVLVDWSQNDPHKTTVSVYSLRARERPTISTPLHWEEVERGARARRELELSAEPAALLQRLDREGELFAPMLKLVQTLPDLRDASSLQAALQGEGA